MNLATRTLSGTPTVAQSAATYTWRVTDTDGDTDEEEFTIEVLADDSPRLPATPPIGAQTYITGSAITALVLPAATGGNAPLTYTLTPTPPQGLSVNLATRTLSGTPTVAQSAATYTWRVTDTDGDTDEEEFTIEVLADDSPRLPATPPIGAQTYITGSAITALVLPAATGGNAPLTYTLTPTPPQGLSVNLATRTLSGTPTVAQSAATYTWRVTDTDGDTDEEEFTIEVLADDSPQLPATPPIGAQTYITGSAITALVLPAATGGNAPLTYTLTPTPPQGLSVNLATRTLSGTPTVAQSAATYTWRVTDTDGDTDEEEFTIEVLADDSPQLPATPPIGAQTYITGSAITALVLPAATGGNAPLTYTLTPTPPQGLSVNLATRTLSGTPTVAQSAATYTWRVTDTDGDTDEEEFTIEVLADDSPQLPATPPIGAQTYITGSAITALVLPAATGGNAPLTYTLTPGLPRGLSVNLATRTLSGTPTVAQSAATYTWRVTDTDGDTDEEEFTIEVLGDDSPRLPATPPIGAQTYITGSAITALVLPAATGGNAPLSYTLTPGLPRGLSVDLATRTLSGTPTVAQSAATYTWRVTDTDGDTDEQEFTIEVLGDQSPQLAAVDDVTYIAGSPITPLVLPEGTGGNAPLTHLLVGRPPAGLTFDTPTRTLSGTPSAAQAATTYTWRVTDTDGDTAEREFTITVLGDQSPQLAAVDDVTYIAGSPITPLVLPEGTGGNAPLTHLLVGRPPAGLTFDTPTRTLSGTPSAAQAATTYTWRVTDTDGDTAEREFTITVEAAGTLTLSGTVGDLQFVLNTAISNLVLPSATGGRAPLTYTLEGTLPDGLQYDSATRTLSGTPTRLQQRASYTWRVTDAVGNTDSQTFGITVVESSEPDANIPEPATRISSIAITSTPRFESTYRLGEVVEVTAAFTRVVYVTGAPGLTLQVGSQRVDARYVRGSGSNHLVFAYPVAAGDLDEDGLSVNPGRLRIEGGSEVSDRRGPRTIWFHPSLQHDPDHLVNGTPLVSVTQLAVVSDPGEDETYADGDVIEIEASFSGAVEVAGNPTLDIQIGAVSRPAVYRSGSGTDRLLFAYTVQAGDRDENGIAVAAGILVSPQTAITGPGGDSADLSSDGLADQAGHKVEGQGPAITSLRIVSDPGPDGAYRPGDEIRIAVAFDEPVVVTGRPELDLAIGAARRRAVFETGSGTAELVFAYQVREDDHDDDGVSVPAGTLAAPSSAGVADLGGFPAELAHGGLADQAGHTIDGQGPSITSLRMTSDPGEQATYGQGAVIRISVVYDEPVLVEGKPELPIMLGDTLSQAVYESGSGGTELVFAYTVQESDRDDDGVSVPAGLLAQPAGASVADRSGNPAVGGHNGLANQPDHKVDGAGPSVTSFRIVSDPGADEIYTVGDVIRIEAEFDEPIVVTGEPRLDLAVGMQRREAVFESGTGTTRLVFSYEVAADDEDLNGISIPRGMILLPGEAALSDEAGNPTDGMYDGLPDQSGHKVDGMQDLVAPTVSSLNVVSNAGSDGIYRTGDEIRLAVSFSEAVTVTGAAEIALTIGATQQGAAYSSGSGSATLEFAYTVRDVDRDDDGISVDANRLTSSGIADEAGNPADLGHEGLPAQPRHKVNLPTVTQAEKAILTKALGAIAGNMITSVTNNIGTRFTTLRSRPGPSLTLAGQQIDLKGSEQAAAAYLMADARRRGFGMGRMTGEDMLRGTAFSLPFGPSGRNGEAPAWTAWGLGDLGMFEGQGQPGSQFSGSLRSAYAGVDVRLGKDVLVGVAASRGMGEADYSFGADGGPKGAGGLQTTLTNIHPYIRARTGDQGEIWAVFGVGRGKAENSPSERTQESSNLGAIMAVGGTRQEIGKAGGVDLAVTADAGYAKLSTGSGEQAIDGLTAEAWRARAGVEVSTTSSIGTGSSAATPFVSASVRNDGGDGAVGTGLELAGGIRVVAPESRVGLEAKGRYLAMHTESGYKEWGASIAFTLAARPDGGGPSLSVAPSIGTSADDANFMWRDQGLGSRGFATSLAPQGPRVDLRGGWGIRMSRFTVTPFAEVMRGISRAGIQLAPSFAELGALKFEVAVERMSFSVDRPDNRLVVTLTKLF